MKPAEQVRDYANRHYIIPARAEKSLTVTFTSGEIHKALGFTNRFPLVCDSLSTRIFETECKVKLKHKVGPKHGSKVSFTFQL